MERVKAEWGGSSGVLCLPPPATPSEVMVVYREARACAGPKPTRPIIVIADTPAENTMSDIAIDGCGNRPRFRSHAAATAAPAKSRSPAAIAPPRSVAIGLPKDANRYAA